MSAHDAINGFIRHLADQGFSVSTRRIRRHFLNEYLRHAEQHAEQDASISAMDLVDPARASAWLEDAEAGRTRTRTAMSSHEAAARPNSMRVRTDSFNAFAEFLGLPGRVDTQPPADGFRLTPGDTKQLLRELAAHRPVYANAAMAMRTAAMAALVADTDKTVPELAGLTVKTLHLDEKDGQAFVDLADGPCPLSEPAVQIIDRWLVARAAIIAELEGSDPGHLWIPVKPGRPRGGHDPVKPGLTPAAVRTLHAAHRTLVSRVLGAPLRPGAFREAAPSRSQAS